MEEFENFKILVKKMRDSQKKFHKSTKNSEAWSFHMNESIRLEKMVDFELNKKTELNLFS